MAKIKVEVELETKPANKDNPCEDCALKAGRFSCWSRAICPFTDNEPLNFKVSKSMKPIA